jgi:hypothetical protein
MLILRAFQNFSFSDPLFSVSYSKCIFILRCSKKSCFLVKGCPINWSLGHCYWLQEGYRSARLNHGSWCEPKFEAFRESTLQKCRILSIEEPRDERVHKIPRRINDNPETAVHLSPKDKFRIWSWH